MKVKLHGFLAIAFNESRWSSPSWLLLQGHSPGACRRGNWVGLSADLVEKSFIDHAEFVAKMCSVSVSCSLWTFLNKIRFYDEELLASRPTPKLEDRSLSAVCDCLFNIFAVSLHTGGRSSIYNLRTRHAVVTGTRLSRRALVNAVMNLWVP